MTGNKWPYQRGSQMIDADCEESPQAQYRRLVGVDRWLMRLSRDQVNSHVSTLLSEKCLVVWRRVWDGNLSPTSNPGAFRHRRLVLGIPNQGGDYWNLQPAMMGVEEQVRYLWYPSCQKAACRCLQHDNCQFWPRHNTQRMPHGVHQKCCLGVSARPHLACKEYARSNPAIEKWLVLSTSTWVCADDINLLPFCNKLVLSQLPGRYVFTVFYLNRRLRCIRHVLSRLQSAGQQ